MGCMAGFLEIFNLNQRIYGPKRISSLAAGSSSPSQRSDFSAREASEMLPSTPENLLKISPALKTPVSAFDFKEGIKNSWKLREAPRLSLDSRLKPSQIRTPPANHSPASNSEHCTKKNRPSPSVVAKLMGLENLPGSNGVLETAAQLRRSASESRVSRDLNPFFLSEPDFKSESTAKRTSPQQATAVVQKRSNFNSMEFYPEPNNRSEMFMYKEAEKGLKMGRTNESSRDLEALKQVLEALQLKGLLHSRVGGNVVLDKPIVVMKPGPKPGKRWSTQEKQVRSPRKNGPVLGPNRSLPKPSLVTNKSPKNRRSVKHSTISPGEDDSTISTVDLERLKSENRAGKNLLERCNKLLENISAFTSTDQITNSEQQPSPVSVLDSTFLNEESSPSPVKKCSLNFKDQFEEWEFKCVDVPKPNYVNESEYTDYVYVSDIVSAFNHYPNVRASDIYLFLEQHYTKTDASKESILNRCLLFDTINEMLDRNHHHSPREDMIKKVWVEMSGLRDLKEMENLNEFTREIIKKDLKREAREWSDYSVEVPDTVLYVERLMFRDLVGEMIRDFVDVVVGQTRKTISRRKLLF